MTDRRRATRFVAVALAGLAVAGTTAATPAPIPTVVSELDGAVHLTVESPVAIQPIDVQVAAGDLVTVDLAVSVSRLPADGSVMATIATMDEATPAADRGASAPTASGAIAQARFPFTCDRPPCRGAYGIVITWAGAPAGASADVAWHLSATGGFRAGGQSPAPRSIIVTAGNASAPESAQLSSATGGKPVHLTEPDRFQAWTVAFHRDGGANGDPRPLTQAQIRVKAVQSAGTGSGSTDATTDPRVDPPVQLRVISAGLRREVRWVSDPALIFDPFTTCAAAGPCDTEATIELAWADGRAETTFDAGWTLDVAAIGRTGSAELVTTTVSAIAPVDLVSATAAGSLVVSTDRGYQESNYVATGRVAIDQGSPWFDIGLPARGVVTVRVTAVGSTPLPADTVITFGISGSLFGEKALHPDETATLAFEPTLSCVPGQPNGCEVRGTIAARVSAFNPKPGPIASFVRIDWSMELGLAVTNDGGLVVAVDPSPSPAPSR